MLFRDRQSGTSGWDPIGVQGAPRLLGVLSEGHVDAAIAILHRQSAENRFLTVEFPIEGQAQQSHVGL